MKSYDAFYINGGWVSPAGNGSVDVINPSNEEVIATLPLAVAADVDAAVDAARAAFEPWSRTSPEERAGYLEKIAGAMKERRAEIAETLAREMGMPLKMAGAIQTGLPMGTMANFARIAREYEFEHDQGSTHIIREAIGVCGFITPWNYPLHQIAGKVAPALAAGCTMVLKPSEMAPLNAFLLADVIDGVGLPAGVFNLVNGVGPTAGEAIAAHPGIDMVSFTGSTRAGKRVAELATRNVKRVTLELGGKSANIILDDADFEKAVPAGVKGCYLNSGQTCSAPTRMLVPRSRMAEAVALAKATAESFRVGDPFDERSNQGPIVHAAQFDKVRKMIETGIAEGATLVTGGAERPAGLDKGYFVKPTVFSDVRNDMTIAREEIFGPVLCIIPYDDDDDAVRIANDSDYGLAGNVWSGDKQHAIRVARAMRTGQIGINGNSFDPNAPFGGYKQSGNGREFGTFGLEEFLEVKALLGYAD